jgi:hypothetical protein
MDNLTPSFRAWAARMQVRHEAMMALVADVRAELDRMAAERAAWGVRNG